MGRKQKRGETGKRELPQAVVVMPVAPTSNWLSGLTAPDQCLPAPIPRIASPLDVERGPRGSPLGDTSSLRIMPAIASESKCPVAQFGSFFGQPNAYTEPGYSYQAESVGGGALPRFPAAEQEGAH